MKTFLTVLSTAVMVLVAGAAYAIMVDGLDASGAYTGRVLDDERVISGAAAGGLRDDILERSTATWEVLFGSTHKDLSEAYRVFDPNDKIEGMKGAAPGGSRGEGDKAVSFIDILSPPVPAEL